MKITPIVTIAVMTISAAAKDPMYCPKEGEMRCVKPGNSHNWSVVKCVSWVGRKSWTLQAWCKDTWTCVVFPDGMPGCVPPM